MPRMLPPSLRVRECCQHTFPGYAVERDCLSVRRFGSSSSAAAATHCCPGADRPALGRMLTSRITRLCRVSRTHHRASHHLPCGVRGTTLFDTGSARPAMAPLRDRRGVFFSTGPSLHRALRRPMMTSSHMARGAAPRARHALRLMQPTAAALWAARRTPPCRGLIRGLCSDAGDDHALYAKAQEDADQAAQAGDWQLAIDHLEQARALSLESVLQWFALQIDHPRSGSYAAPRCSAGVMSHAAALH